MKNSIEFNFLLCLLMVVIFMPCAYSASYAIQNTLNQPVEVSVWTLTHKSDDKESWLERTTEPLKAELPKLGENGSTWTFRTGDAIDVISWDFIDKPFDNPKSTTTKDMLCSSDHVAQNWNWQIVEDGVRTWEDWTPDGYKRIPNYAGTGQDLCVKQ